MLREWLADFAIWRSQRLAKRAKQLLERSRWWTALEERVSGVNQEDEHE